MYTEKHERDNRSRVRISMRDEGKQNVVGVNVDCVDYDSSVARVIGAASAHQPLTVSALAVHGVMTGVLDKEHLYRLNKLDLVVPDGQPVRWAMNWLHGCKLTDRVYGPSLTLKLCGAAAESGVSVFLFGSHAGVLEKLSANLTARFPALVISGARPSAFRKISASEKVALAEEIRKSGAGIVFVGLGCPRQEVWAYEFREHLSMPIVAVGAAFDFHAGESRQAPECMQKLGLEWLYRLLQEPTRLWRRYLFLNPLYLLLVLAQKLRLIRFHSERATAPLNEIGYG